VPKAGKNIYKRKDGRWEGRYSKHRDSNGKTIYGSVYGKSCTEVKKRLALILSSEPPDKPSFTVAPKNNLTFADAANQWLSGVSLKVKQSTYAGYATSLDLHILPSIGNCKLQKITASDINCFAKNKMEKGRTDGNGGLSSKTVRDMLSMIKSVIDFAWSEKIIPNRLSITYPKHQQQTIRVLSRQEQSNLEIVLTTDTSIYKLGILLCLYTGLRVGEIVGKIYRRIMMSYWLSKRSSASKMLAMMEAKQKSS
jgi:integrase